MTVRQGIDSAIDIYNDKLSIYQDNQSPENLTIQNEFQEDVYKNINRLPDLLRSSLVLREIGELSYEQISVVMKCPVGTVRSRLFRARAA